MVMRLPKRRKRTNSHDVCFTLSDSQAVAAQVLCERAEDIDGRRYSVSELCKALVVAALPMTLDQMRKDGGTDDDIGNLGGYVAGRDDSPAVEHDPTEFGYAQSDLLDVQQPGSGDAR
jgi:hypothetical protein